MRREGVSERAVDQPHLPVSTIWHHCHPVIIIAVIIAIIIVITIVIITAILSSFFTRIPIIITRIPTIILIAKLLLITETSFILCIDHIVNLQWFPPRTNWDFVKCDCWQGNRHQPPALCHNCALTVNQTWSMKSFCEHLPFTHSDKNSLKGHFQWITGDRCHLFLWPV